MTGSEENPVISVIVPSYNKPEYLPECLESIRAQTFTDWECIVVSDGSPRVEEIRAAVAAMGDERFRLVEHRENRGLAAARNTGVREARADLVLWLDEDDVIRCDCLQILVRLLGSSRADIVCPCAKFFGGANNAKRCVQPTLEGILRAMLMLPGGYLISKETFSKIGPFDENETIKLGREDHEWWIRAVSSGVKILVCDEELCYIRKPGNEKEAAHSLDLRAMRHEYTIYKYIVTKHDYYYRKYSDIRRHVLLKAIKRQNAALRGNCLWKTVLLSYLAVRHGQSMKALRWALQNLLNHIRIKSNKKN